MTHPHTAAVRGGLTGPKNGASLTAGGGDRAAPGSFDPAEAARCRALWAEVINKALADCHCGEYFARNEAVAWFTNNGRNFRLVCDLAGVDPVAVRKRALAHINGDRIKKIQRSENGGTKNADLVAKVLAEHAAGRSPHQILKIIGHGSAETYDKIIRANGLTPHKMTPGTTAYRQRHDEIMAAMKKGAQVSAARKSQEAAHKAKPVLALLAADPSMSVKEAARRCGVPYGTAKTQVRKAIGRDR